MTLRCALFEDVESYLRQGWNFASVCGRLSHSAYQIHGSSCAVLPGVFATLSEYCCRMHYTSICDFTNFSTEY
jgi:hypothetical protein